MALYPWPMGSGLYGMMNQYGYLARLGKTRKRELLTLYMLGGSFTIEVNLGAGLGSGEECVLWYQSEGRGGGGGGG